VGELSKRKVERSDSQLQKSKVGDIVNLELSVGMK